MQVEPGLVVSLPFGAVVPSIAGMAALYLVSTPIGNLEDVTVRAAKVLASVDRVLAEDTRRSRVLLDHLGIKTTLVSLHAHNEAARSEAVLGWLDSGEALALVSDAGTPLVSDPGERLVRAVLDGGHDVVAIPGASAVLTALVASGLPSERFTFLGFPARKGKARSELLGRVGVAAETVVLFESPRRLVRTLSDLGTACGPEREVVVARELTKVHESFFRGTLDEARAYYDQSPPRGEVTIVVASAAGASDDIGGSERAARELATALLAEGMRSSQVARLVAERSDVSRNTAYRIVQTLAE